MNPALAIAIAGCILFALIIAMTALGLIEVEPRAQSLDDSRNDLGDWPRVPHDFHSSHQGE